MATLKDVENFVKKFETALPSHSTWKQTIAWTCHAAAGALGNFLLVFTKLSKVTIMCEAGSSPTHFWLQLKTVTGEEILLDPTWYQHRTSHTKVYMAKGLSKEKVLMDKVTNAPNYYKKGKVFAVLSCL